MKDAVQSYRDLKVWQKSRSLVTDIYHLTQSFPKEEMYGLTSQIKRAAISVPSNIAEGSAKNSTREFLRFLAIAYGSLAELETQLYLAFDLQWITEKKLETTLEKTSELGKMMNGLMNSLEQKLLPNPAELKLLNSDH